MTRVLIVVFDALRPEFVTPELMPTLWAFAQAGVRFTDHHSTFPTETRVNQSALTTGCYPRRHGIVANRFPLAEAAPGTVVNTGDDVAFEAMLTALQGRLLDVPTMGEILAANGRSFATISAGTSGGGRLINLHASDTGSFRFALRRPEVSQPDGVEAEIARLLGPVPDYALPGIGWNDYAVDAYLRHVEPVICPDVMLLWLCEPDESFHRFGIGAPESLAAIRGVDAAFGRILARQRAAIEAGALQVVALSDHGQITLAGPKLDLTARMQAAGLDASTSPAGDPDYTVVVHNAGGIWVRGNAPERIAAMVDWLHAQDWCGPVFTRDGGQGTLPIAEICADHPRAPDIYLVLAHDDAVTAHGMAGQSADNAPYPTGGGCHGGLSRYELHNVLALGGRAFAPGTVCDAPSGNVDILPTVLHLLGITLDHQIDGRVLTEAFGDPPEPVRPADIAAARTRLRVQDYRGTRYLDRAWAAGQPAPVDLAGGG